MPIIELKQGSPEWLKYRRNRIMATDASIILGTNDYQTPLDVYEDKHQLAPQRKITPAMLRGQKLEPEARELACKMLGIDFQPCVYECDEYPWMAASLDGLSPCGKYILEIKCPGENTHSEALNGIIKEYYITQMQHQMACKGKDVEKCFYLSYRPESKTVAWILDVFPDPEWKTNSIRTLKEFYINTCQLCPPQDSWKMKLKTKNVA